MSRDILSAAESIPSSCLHRIFRAAERREAESGTDVVKLHVGDPYFNPSDDVADAFVDAVRRGDTKYTGVEGLGSSARRSSTSSVPTTGWTARSPAC